MMNTNFAFASHLHDVHCLAAANSTALGAGWYSVVVVVVAVAAAAPATAVAVVDSCLTGLAASSVVIVHLFVLLVKTIHCMFVCSRCPQMSSGLMVDVRCSNLVFHCCPQYTPK